MRITTPRYKVTFEGWLYTEEVDICMDCFKRIAEEIEQTDLLVKTPHKSRVSHEKNCETCRDKDAYDEWQGSCDECENGSMYTPQTETSTNSEKLKLTVEPQIDCEACELDGKADVCKTCRASIYEPQTDCAWK